jgi:para-nitrobenzyl esterase
MSNPVITTSGPVVGSGVEGVISFLGIPYGGSTAGLGRFRPPVPPVPWTAVRDAATFGPACPQPAIEVPGVTGREPEPQSEDCLVLNVFTPAADTAARPVMVWFHGGAWTVGSGSGPQYDGSRLAARGDVVVVTVNHRLGYLGFLYLAELGGGEYADSGNVGALDMHASLEWVRNNIAAFGGNPNNVTIFGESGGGWKISTLLGMPSTSGLFHRAIVQSGPLLRAVEPAAATAVARDMMTKLGVASIEELVRTPVSEFVAAQLEILGNALGEGAPLGPVLDGRTMPHHFFDPEAAPSSLDVPLLIGSCRDEMTLFSIGLDPERFSERALERTARERFGDEHKEALAIYQKERPDASPFDLYIAIASDRFRVGSVRIAERRAAASPSPVYMYRFDYESTAFGGRLGAAHGIDIAFVFDNLAVEGLGLVENTPDAQKLADRTSDAWLSFARSGDPNHAGLPTWPRYDTDHRSTMIFDDDCHVIDDPAAAERRAWDHVSAPM